jgi:hypothetical protein
MGCPQAPWPSWAGAGIIEALDLGGGHVEPIRFIIYSDYL